MGTTENQVLRRAQLYTTAEVEPWTVGASMDTTFKLDTALNLDCDQILDIIWVSDTKQMSRSWKSIMQYCAIKDFNFTLLKNLEFKKFGEKNWKLLPPPLFLQ